VTALSPAAARRHVSLEARLKTLGYRLRHGLWHRIRAVLDLFHWLPLAAAVIIAKLLTTFGQLRELYISYVEQMNPVHIAFALLGFSMISGALYAAHFQLSAIRENIIFANFVRPDLGINFRRLRRGIGLALAFAPWAALAWGFGAAAWHLHDLDPKLSGLGMGALGWKVGAAAVVVGFFGLIVSFLLHAFRQSQALLWSFVSLTVLIIVFSALAPFLKLDIVALYRGIGPLATLSVALLFVLSTLTVLALLAQKSGFPTFMLIFSVLAIGALFNAPFEYMAYGLAGLCALLAILAAIARYGAVTSVALLLGALAYFTAGRETKLNDAATAAPSKTHGALRSRFEEWLGDRPEKWIEGRRDAAGAIDESARYPVFIVAVEGGGIFAATAASLFLARLQEMEPSFARHVFAISGVSGGAIGATLFQALAREKSGPIPPECGDDMTGTQSKDDGPLSKKISKIMRDDHFSPVVGSIAHDFLIDPSARAGALERSFVSSAGTCDSRAGKLLDGLYKDHWSGPGAAAPALVLNATWAETGYRVAFAPFELHAPGNQTLYSFSDKNMPGDGVRLMKAAVVSARFPFILSPYTFVRKPNPEENEEKPETKSERREDKGAGKKSGEGTGNKWHFVDGGYADSSGAATALDLYRALETTAQARKVEIKVILLTSSDPRPDFNRIEGTAFRETLAPISAIMAVRKGLGNQAVARACEYLALPDCKTGNGITPWKLRVVWLDEEAYGLPLGWKISNATFNVLRALVGHVDLCENAPADDATIRQNSCVHRDVKNTISATK
jgi:hypothetical protein